MEAPLFIVAHLKFTIDKYYLSSIVANINLSAPAFVCVPSDDKCLGRFPFQVSSRSISFSF